MTFDRVLPVAVKICEESPLFAKFEQACIVRDIRGRTRLVLKPAAATPDAEKSAEVLGGLLAAALGAFFSTPVWLTTDRAERGGLARKALEVGDTWLPTYEDGAGVQKEATKQKWFIVERRLSKQVWLESGQPSPPWKLADGVPIVTFYSFKGGVGRTTALASCAWQLAESGKRVAIVDLDLEAPGIGVLLDAESERGVLDYVIDHIASGVADVTDCLAPARAFGKLAANADVFPAGRLSRAYLEKLSRMDYFGSEPFEKGSKSPVEAALRILLTKVRGTAKPDYILIDSRAGLHDLAGLSLHGLAHIDVIVGRASKQAYEGLDLTLEAFASRRQEEDRLCIIVHSMAPPDPESEIAKIEEKEFREASYKSFLKWIYEEGEAPNEGATDQQHSPHVVRYDLALERAKTVSSLRDNLFAKGYVELLSRILELATPETDS